MDSNKIKAIIVVVLSLFAALYLGISAATAQLETVIWVVGGVSFTICLLLGHRIYLIIPFMTSIGLVLPLPGLFGSDIIAQGIYLGFATLLFLTRRFPMKGGITEIEFWCLLLIGSVVQVYMRNPVGLNLFGGDSVGAKPYFVFALTTTVALALSISIINPADLKTWVRLSFIGSILNAAIGMVGYFVPTVGYYLGTSVTSGSEAAQQAAYDGRATRILFVRNISVALALWVSSRISPLRACFHPLWMPLVLFSLALAGLSGYRSQIILVGLIYFVGIFYRGGIKSIAASVLLGIAGLSLLAVVHLAAPLPTNLQRSLSFLPGSWDRSVTSDAESSTDWRVEMWKEALFTERWITNKWLGDGLGFTRKELNQMLALQEGKLALGKGASGMTVQQESMMISGNYHSGPVQTVRSTGYFGLAILLIAMLRVAVHAHRQILRCRGTEWYPSTLFLCIPLIVTPIFWTFVFGTFGGGISAVLMGGAMVRLLEKNLPLPAYLTRRKQAHLAKMGGMQAPSRPAEPN